MYHLQAAIHSYLVVLRVTLHTLAQYAYKQGPPSTVAPRLYVDWLQAKCISHIYTNAQVRPRERTSSSEHSQAAYVIS